MAAMSMAKSIGQSAEFQFEDLFSSSGPSSSSGISSVLAGSWNAPDNAAFNAPEFEATEEDIGEEQDYSSSDEEVDKPMEKDAKKGTSPPKQDPAPEEPLPRVESIKLSSNIGLNSFNKLVMVGKGGFGQVHQVVFKETNEIFAMKSLKKKHLIETNSVDNTKAEKDILRKIRHPFIVRLHYAFQSDSKLHLIMDFVNGGHLLHHMHKETLFSEHQARFYIAEVILAIEHLHSLDIIHRDLKPENCLLDSKGHCVLTDFGFAKENVTDPESCSSFCGTLEYMAPEVIKKKKYGKAADWWAVGILLYDMLVGNPPFQSKNDNALYKKILGDKLKMPTYLSRECQALLKGLIHREIKCRLTLPQIKAHPFFKGLNWKRMLAKDVRPPIVPIITDGIYDVTNFDEKYVRAKMSESIPNSPLSTSQQLQFAGFSYAKSPAVGALKL